MVEERPDTPEPLSLGDGGSVELWALKPWWCQPWSILLTGLVVVLGSWWALHRWWITVPTAVVVVIWWGLFLVLVPAAFRQQVEAEVQNRKR